MISEISLKQHLAYSKDPELFMKERWLTFNAFKGYKYEFITPFEYQLNFIRNIHNIQNNIIVKSRQMHVSSMVSLYIAWYVLFNYDKQVTIISSSSDSAKRIIENIRIILEAYLIAQNEKDWEKEFITNNKMKISLKNGCRIQASAPSTDAGRGCRIDLLFIDEGAYVQYFTEIWMALGMAINPGGGKAIIASSPKDNSFFNKLFLESTEYFNSIRLHWSLHPEYSKGIKKDINQKSSFEYTSPWFEQKCKILGYVNSQIEQEFECIVRFNEETNKTKIISLRIDSDMYKKIQGKLNDRQTASDYIRTLIEKDLKY